MIKANPVVKQVKLGTLCLAYGSSSVNVRSNYESGKLMSQAISASWLTAEGKQSQSKLSPEKLSNYDLILRCQEGFNPDRVAFAELLNRYQSHVDRILYHLAPDWQDRADLAQEVWIRVYRNIKRLNEPMKFRGWLSRIATNLFYDELRKRKRVSHPVSLDAPRRVDDGEIEWDIVSDYPSPNDNLATREFYDRLRLAIADLPEAFRTTIVLREIDGLAYEEIAEMTGVSLGTVKSRIARARAKLQSVLQPYLD
ncbi:RNA polymerase sigma factor [Aphanothece sacrum FPU1]|uniref:RNA polymerase sigma factor n=2 Tax=Aphanothece sacrum TaxID=1122 RepID=A0A401IJT2_APHSA|nr:RNA polymerase sigma factor [Aphanothece sacrum FPU1]GBF85571.1 RNA polymerase, sigma-24 subunit, ECF subfamily [Aphanothece sacrum FPU3]